MCVTRYVLCVVCHVFGVLCVVWHSVGFGFLHSVVGTGLGYALISIQFIIFSSSSLIIIIVYLV